MCVAKVLKREFGIDITKMEPPVSGAHAQEMLKRFRGGQRQRVRGLLKQYGDGSRIISEEVVYEGCDVAGNDFMSVKRIVHSNGRVTMTT